MRFLLPVAAVLFVAAAAAARAAAPVTIAPAADGGIDLRDGKGRRRARGAQDAGAAPRPARLREVVVDDHRIAELRVPIRGTPAEEVWIGEVGAPEIGARCSGRG